MGGEIEEFKKMLTHFVRDAAIKDCDIILRADKNTPIKKRWQEAKQKNNPDELARIIIADCVDQAIFFLLQSIDEEALKISFEALNGEQLKLYQNGELAGAYISGDWRSQYSNERFFDDFS